MTGTFDFMKKFLTDRCIKNFSAHANWDDLISGSMHDEKWCFQAFDFLVVFKGFPTKGVANPNPIADAWSRALLNGETRIRPAISLSWARSVATVEPMDRPKMKIRDGRNPITFAT